MKTLSILVLLLFVPTALHANRLRDLETQVGHIEKKLTHTFNELSDIKNRKEDASERVAELDKALAGFKADTAVLFEDLRTELGAIKGEMDFLKHEVEQIKKENQRLYDDVQFRLNELERKPAATPPAPKTVEMSPDEVYQHHLNLLQKNKQYDQAIDGLRAFVDKNPQHNLVPNARYWIAEGYYAQGKFARAITSFDEVVKKHPGHPKKCDALLKQALGFEALKKRTEAKLFFEEVLVTCPKTKNATQAQEKLKAY